MERPIIKLRFCTTCKCVHKNWSINIAGCFGHIEAWALTQYSILMWTFYPQLNISFTIMDTYGWQHTYFQTVWLVWILYFLYFHNITADVAEANKVKQIKCFAKKLEHSCIENRACMDDLNYLDRLAAICRRKLCCNSLLLIFCVFVYLFRLDVTGTSRCLILPSTGWLVINTGFVTRLACTWWSSERECTQLQPDKKSSITLILR